VGSDELGVDAPCLRRGHPAAQLFHALLGAGDLETARLGEDTHLLVLTHAVERQVGDLPGVVHREDEVRGMTGRPAGVGKPPFVDLDDVTPARAGKGYKRVLPTIPAPTTTTRAEAGTVAMRLPSYRCGLPCRDRDPPPARHPDAQGQPPRLDVGLPRSC